MVYMHSLLVKPTNCDCFFNGLYIYTTINMCRCPRMTDSEVLRSYVFIH